MQYWWLLYRHSKLLGQRTDVYRNVEDAYSVRQAGLVLTKESIYLDIGSGSSLVPTFLFQRHGATTYATEMDPVYLQRQITYQSVLGIPPGGKFHVQAEDATKLSFPDKSIDLVTAISTIEHIPGDGDSRAMAEFARVLRPGGRLVVTVPTSPLYQEAESTFYYSGFERRYDAAALRSRLDQEGLRVIDELHMVSPPEEFNKLLHEQFAEVLQGQNISHTWYQNAWHDQYPDISILLTLALIRLSSKFDGSVGGMLTYEKTGRADRSFEQSHATDSTHTAATSVPTGCGSNSGSSSLAQAEHRSERAEEAEGCDAIECVLAARRAVITRFSLDFLAQNRQLLRQHARAVVEL